jgi:hypothetical protein
METTPEQIEQLRQTILATFPMADPPPHNEITSHPCDECAEVASDFSGVKWWSADPVLIDENFDDLPLFTPRAYRYYLPAFLLRALDSFDPDNLVTEFCIFDLSGDPHDDWYRKRIEQLTSDEAAISATFLRYICSDARFGRFHSDAASALREVWSAANAI